MLSTLTVTATTPTAALDSARQGKASFAAVNNGSQPIRVRAYASPEGTASGDWFAVDGLPVREIAPGASEAYSVAINVPATAPPGKYGFKLNIVGVDNPDEQFASSQAVGFEVSAAVVRPPVKKGYMEALAGGLVGALAGGAIGIIPAILFIMTTGEPADLGSVLGSVICFAILAVVGAPLGLWIGASIGTWAGLKWRGCQYAVRTALLTALLSLILLVAVGFLLGAINIENDTISQVVTVIAAAIVVAGASVGARALVLLLTTKQL